MEGWLEGGSLDLGPGLGRGLSLTRGEAGNLQGY